jgi:hypothetical protein
MIITETDIKMINESLLKSKVIVEFNDVEDLESVIISFSTRLQKFVLELNGELIHSSKTFKSLVNKTEQLVEERELSQMTWEQF